MNEQLDYRIVQFLGPGETDRPSLQSFETRPEGGGCQKVCVHKKSDTLLGHAEDYP